MFVVNDAKTCRLQPVGSEISIYLFGLHKSILHTKENKYLLIQCVSAKWNSFDNKKTEVSLKRTLRHVDWYCRVKCLSVCNTNNTFAAGCKKYEKKKTLQGETLVDSSRKRVQQYTI